jgi:hypothetical protein
MIVIFTRDFDNESAILYKTDLGAKALEAVLKRVSDAFEENEVLTPDEASEELFNSKMVDMGTIAIEDAEEFFDSIHNIVWYDDFTFSVWA